MWYETAPRNWNKEQVSSLLQQKPKELNKNPKSNFHLTTNGIGHNKVPILTISAPQIGEMLSTDEITKELYMTSFATTTLIRNEKMLRRPPDFKNGLKSEALVDSRTLFSAIHDTDLDRIKR